MNRARTLPTFPYKRHFGMLSRCAMMAKVQMCTKGLTPLVVMRFGLYCAVSQVCYRVTPGELGMAKTEWVWGVLQSWLTTGLVRGSVEDYAAKCGKAFPFPRLVLKWAG